MAKFYGIGVGPGDREYLTVKAVRILQELDVLILPEARRSSGSIAFQIAKEYIRTETQIYYVEFPMVQDYERIIAAGAEAARIVEAEVSYGKNVGFITLGDPSVYSTYSYILKSLDKGVQVETIPGITSFCAAAALLNKSLVEGEEILSIIPATASYEGIDRAIAASAGLAIMKVFSNGERVLELLNKHGRTDSCTLVKRCGMKDCTIETDIEAAISKDKQYLSIIIGRKGES